MKKFLLSTLIIFLLSGCGVWTHTIYKAGARYGEGSRQADWPNVTVDNDLSAWEGWGSVELRFNMRGRRPQPKDKEN